MMAPLVSELRKITSTRIWWIMALLLFGYMAFLGAVMAFSLAVDGGAEAMTGQPGSGPLPAVEVALSAYTLAAALGYVFPLVVGALAMTGEFRHQTITPSLLAEPRRGVLLGAKLGASLLVGLVHGVLGTLGAVAGAAPVLAVMDEPVLLGDGGVLTALLLCVLALAIWAMIGVGLGTMLTNQVAAVVVILAFTQFVEPILRMGFAAVDALEGLSRFFPGAAAEALVGTSLYSTTGLATLLSRWEGGLVLLGYAVLFALIGRYTTLRRDVT